MKVTSLEASTTSGLTKQMVISRFIPLFPLELIYVSGGSLGEFYVNNGQDSLITIPYPRPFTEYFLGTQEGTGKMYPWLHQQAIEEGFNNLTKRNPASTSCEYMSLTRSTFVGGQRFCSYLWSGDTDSRFDVLLQQIATGVSIAASGISSWTLDIGGFAGLDIDTNEVSVSFLSRRFRKCSWCVMFVGKRVVCEMVWDGCFPSICRSTLALWTLSSFKIFDYQTRVHGYDRDHKNPQYASLSVSSTERAGAT